MKKKDRTDDERTFDKLLKGGMMRLGAQPSEEAATPNPYPYVLYWDKLGRKGQRCRILKPGQRIVLLEFEDGFKHTCNKMAIRRDERCSLSSSSCLSPTSLSH
jgi:hypothetical protein